MITFWVKLEREYRNRGRYDTREYEDTTGYEGMFKSMSVGFATMSNRCWHL